MKHELQFIYFILLIYLFQSNSWSCESRSITNKYDNKQFFRRLNCWNIVIVQCIEKFCRHKTQFTRLIFFFFSFVHFNSWINEMITRRACKFFSEKCAVLSLSLYSLYTTLTAYTTHFIKFQQKYREKIMNINPRNCVRNQKMLSDFIWFSCSIRF